MEEDKFKAKLPYRYNYWELIKKFCSTYLNPKRKVFFSVQILHILAAGLILVPPLILRDIIDVAIPERDLGNIITLFLIALGAYFLEAGITAAKEYWGHVVAQEITRDMRNDLYIHYQDLNMRFHDNKKTGELMSRVIDDLNRMQEFVHHGPEALVGSLALLLGTVGLMIYLSPHLTMISLIFVPFLLIFSYVLLKRLHLSFRKIREKKAVMHDRLEDNLAGIKIIKAFANEELEKERFSATNEEHKEARIKAIKYLSILFPGSRFLNALGILVVIGYGGYMVILGQISAGTIVAFYGFLMQFRVPLLRLVNMMEGLSQFFASTERFFSHLELEPDIREKSRSTARQVMGHVGFQNVHFSYDEEEVLRDVSFQVAPQQTVALVGPSGAGKTSIIRLIPRLYDVDSGQVLIDGINVRDWKIRDLRNSIAMVMQDDFLFSNSVTENIAYGRPGAEQEEIIAAAKAANAHEFIEELPQGYDTQVGQRGLKLSGGQKQRISLARAFLKNPRILILDEATSSVDLKTEKLIQEAIARITSQRTTFIIAHRLSTITNAGMILFIDRGRVREMGSHEELMEKAGSYYEFYRMQFEKEKSVTKISQEVDWTG